MSIGKWLEIRGYDVKAPNAAKAPAAAPHSQHHPTPTPPPALAPDKKDKVLKKEKEEDKGPAPLFEPWLDVLKADFQPIKVSLKGIWKYK